MQILRLYTKLSKCETWTNLGRCNTYNYVLGALRGTNMELQPQYEDDINTT